MASSLNNDVEEGKVRKALCGISRKVGEPINLPLFDIKSLYDQILDLTHPGLDPKIHEEKATQHACKCIEFLVSKGIKQLFDNYQRDKVINDESINLVELVNMITQQENKRDEYKITQTMYLPPAWTSNLMSEHLQSMLLLCTMKHGRIRKMREEMENTHLTGVDLIALDMSGKEMTITMIVRRTEDIQGGIDLHATTEKSLSLIHI